MLLSIMRLSGENICASHNYVQKMHVETYQVEVMKRIYINKEV